jgi:hypothetical protein
VEEKIQEILAGSQSHGASLPLPYIIVFLGYAFILLVDRVMFDSHVLFNSDDSTES